MCEEWMNEWVPLDEAEERKKNKWAWKPPQVKGAVQGQSFMFSLGSLVSPPTRPPTGTCGYGHKHREWLVFQMKVPVWLFLKKNCHTIQWPTNPTSHYIPKRIGSRNSNKYLHTHVNGRAMHNSQMVETTRVHWRMDGRTMCASHIQWNVISAFQEE